MRTTRLDVKHTVSGLEHFLKLDFWLRVLIWKNLDASAGGAFETAADSIQKHNKERQVKNASNRHILNAFYDIFSISFLASKQPIPAHPIV